MNTLLDGHPQLHSHPYELHIGHPTKYDWPELDVSTTPDVWLGTLAEGRLIRLFKEGYLKATVRTFAEVEPLPFMLVPSLLERLFRIVCQERPVATTREILDRYLTAFFNAWIDCQGLREPDKCWVTAFAPRLAWGESRPRLWADYPDGRLIAVLRDPRGWFASARVTAQYSDLDTAVSLWARSAQEMLTAKREAPDQVLIVGYEALVTRPREATEVVARWLGIDWDPILEVPTFNRLPVRPNSSHELLSPEVQPAQANRWKSVLEPNVVRAIDSRLLDQYQEVLTATDVPGQGD